MTDKPFSPDERTVDLGAVAADTLLLDTLGRGEPAPADDRVASLLAAWRADLVADLEVLEPDQEAGLEVARLLAGEAGAAGAAGATAPRAGRPYRFTRRMLAAAAAVLVAGGGILVGAGHATPGNPLWPITRVMYPERADNAAAEHTIAQARAAATAGRPDDARRLLAQAETLIARVSDPARVRQLRVELAGVRDLLDAAVPGPSAPAVPAPTPTGPAAGPAATPPTAGGTAPRPTGAAPEPTVTSGGVPPGISVPTLPGVPAPSTGVRVPTDVPTLPGLPSLGGLLPH